ncbi:MAG: cobalt transport protein CbiM [Chloroflexota bacterium]|nr:MAG: cobalt transport protein CbiM [Chloroflexota bacterium]
MFQKLSLKRLRQQKIFTQSGKIGWGLLALLLLSAQIAWANSSGAPPKMHIMEGFLPLWWAVFWWIVAIPFWVVGFIRVRKVIVEKPQQRIMLGLAGGFIFVLSALKIPSVTGSSSHPTGTGLSSLLFGPFVTAILGTIALIFQALLVAHGGISTLGANAISMAIGGPLIAYFFIWFPLRGKTPTWLSVFTTAFVADLATYLITTTQLALAFPSPVSGFTGSWLTFAGIFAITQIPLAVAEGILTVLIFNALQSTAPAELQELGLEGV